MQPDKLSIEDLRELIHKGEVKDPLVFLESVMTGQDPRKLSSIYELICEIDSFTDGNITKSDWSEIVDAITANYKYHTVSLGESINASKTLAEYLYAKRKHIEINKNDATDDISDSPLTEEEIELFREKFNDDF